MRKISLAVALLMTPVCALAWPWSMDMANQISIKPQESVDLANPGMKEFPKRSVPVPGTMTLAKDAAAAEKLKNPVPVDEKSVARGGKLFAIYCTPCHGYEGKGDGLVGAKLALRPYDLSAQQTRQRSDGFIFGYMTFGGAVMPIYANDLSQTERWSIVNYVRKVVQKNNSSEVKTSASK